MLTKDPVLWANSHSLSIFLFETVPVVFLPVTDIGPFAVDGVDAYGTLLLV